MRTLVIIFSFLIMSSSHAMIFEISGDFGYDKMKYGLDKHNSLVSRSYAGGFSSYVFSTTAIDLTYSYSKEITSNNDRYNITGYTVDHLAEQSRVTTSVYGIGIKQMLAPRTAFLVPMISIGYARQFVTSEGDATYLNTSNNSSFVYKFATAKYNVNSMSGAFMLQLKMTELLSFKASVKTLFPAFDYNEAKNNLKYSAGFSWLF